MQQRLRHATLTEARAIALSGNFTDTATHTTQTIRRGRDASLLEGSAPGGTSPVSAPFRSF
eukprot:10445167-Lingulodinium_polyedra.AAC.1